MQVHSIVTSQFPDSRVSDLQREVNAHFQSAAVFWKDIYHRSDVYSVIHQQRQRVVLEIVDHLGLPRSSRILEVGCGAGLTTVELARRGFHIEAVDVVENMLALTRQSAANAEVEGRVKTSFADAHALPHDGNKFDLILAMGVVPWLHSPREALQEMARVLKPGGHMIVNSDNRWRLNHVVDPLRFPPLEHLRRRLSPLLQRIGLRRPVTRSHRYSLKQFDSFLLQAGLEKASSRTLGYGPFSFLNYEILPDSIGVQVHCVLQKLADRRWPVIQSTGSQYIVLARKRQRNQNRVGQS
ncbi:MAG: methyltransferase domain-containing protein [Candidatus Acidiferrales bacterium]